MTAQPAKWSIASHIY